jgi:hypothetical protein
MEFSKASYPNQRENINLSYRKTSFESIYKLNSPFIPQSIIERLGWHSTYLSNFHTFLVNKQKGFTKKMIIFAH